MIYLVDEGSFLVSVTDPRAKTINMRRDPRAVLHVSEPSSWSYLSFDGEAHLSPVTVEVGDETSERLVAYYRQLAGKDHPDWDEYRQAMVAEQRLLARVTPTSVVGQIN